MCFKPPTRIRNNSLARATLAVVDIGFYLPTLFKHYSAVCASAYFLLVLWPVYAQSRQGQ